MKYIYCEIHDQRVHQYPHKYLAFPKFTDRPYSMLTDCERVWVEDELGIRYMKLRGSNFQVDMKELMWGKLSAVYL